MNSQDAPAEQPKGRTMSDEELTLLEIREDRRLINLGIDPDLDPAEIYHILLERERMNNDTPRSK